MAGEVGTIGWTDLTVENAEEIRTFYSEVVGWKADPVDMGGYNDFNMTPPASDEAIAGVCHARGGNTGLPTQWIMYVTVEDVAASARRCEEQERTCVIQDPAGAVLALYQPKG